VRRRTGRGSGKNLVRTGRQRKGLAGGGLLGFMRGRSVEERGLFFFLLFIYLVVDDFMLGKKNHYRRGRGRGRGRGRV